MRALVETVDGVFELDLELEEVIDFDPDGSLPRLEPLELPFPGVIAADASGSTMVAVVGRRPPLVVSYDAGATWTETGGGLPAGSAVAVCATDPDLVLFAARNRLYLSRDGGRFWTSLAPELPRIRAISVMEA
jgi:hypothetical protein